MIDFNEFKCKNNIIYNVLLFKRTKNEYALSNAKKEIEALAKYYRLSLRKQFNIDIDIALEEFVINNKGYVTTIINLYSAL